MNQNQERGENFHPTPEEGEQLHINSIVIPADEEEAIRQHQLAPAKLGDYQQLVGGLIEAVALDQPPGRMYMNEEGKLHDMPVNRRATMLLWAHNRAFRYHDVIMGDAFLVGHPDREGMDSPVDDQYVNLLCEARGFRVEVQMPDDTAWHEYQTGIDNWVEAYELAFTLERSGSRVTDFRVVPEA